ncbi:hypothetical protein KSB_39090 [Ktedonobacter robiniae]|uniref:Uncharacterized protein n=1 Tax=Ktedonobacter robiniae TaxID=2778365 RepID=A0ABQ3URT5_9CHLR|nr:hypothetical protein KSB_39090 [Ktedonobacter robiniae]
MRGLVALRLGVDGFGYTLRDSEFMHSGPLLHMAYAHIALIVGIKLPEDEHYQTKCGE